MRRERIFAAVFVLALAATALAGHYNRTVSVTGGSPQRLSTVMAANGYAGSFAVDELTLCNPPAAANTLYVGQSDVNAANGFPLEPGSCKTERRAAVAVDLTQVYLFVSSTQDASVSARNY